MIKAAALITMILSHKTTKLSQNSKVMIFTFPTLAGPAKVFNRTIPSDGYELNLKWGVLTITRDGKQFRQIFLHKSKVWMKGDKVFVTDPVFSRLGIKLYGDENLKLWYSALKLCSGWAIDKFYIVGEEIGSGSFGSVSEAVHRGTGTEVAIKRIEAHEGTKELELMEQLNHRNVISALDILRTAESSYIVLPRMKSDLHAILKENKDKMMKIDEAKAVFRQILEGVRYIRSLGVVHCDLKPQNIMCMIDPVTGEYVYKIIDFGGAFRMSRQGMHRDRSAFTVGYGAPELMNRSSKNLSTDMFSCGAILFEMLTGKRAISRTCLAGTRERNGRGKYNKYGSTWFSLPWNAQRLISKLMKYNPDKRITPEDALIHRFFK